MYKYFGKCEEKGLNRTPRRRWVANIRMDIKYIVFDIMVFILLVHVRVYSRDLLTKLMSLRIL
jgi:hypothetical protein